MGGFSGEGWPLDFYSGDRPFVAVEDLVPGVGGVWDLARRNGAREGTPFFVGPGGRPDGRVNRFWREPGIRTRSPETLRRYAHSLKVWLNFLAAYEESWDQVGPHTLAAFKEWRMSSADNVEHVGAGSFQNDLTAIRSFYQWASLTFPGIDNPARLVPGGAGLGGGRVERLEASPSAVRRTAAKWLSPEAYRQWRNIGLAGFTAEGLPAASWAGVNEDRDLAFTDGLFGTGLRCGEWSSVLTVEVPVFGDRRLRRCWLAAQCAKRRVGRPYWMPAKVARAARFYMEEGSRAAAVARAQRAGVYERVADRWLVESVRDGQVLVVRDEAGQRREVRLDALGPQRRMKLFGQSSAGLEPLWLWLNQDGRPRPKQAWNDLFDRANARVLRVLGPDTTGRPRLFARPHMLRHSFALRWYSIVTFAKWEKASGLSEAERRDFRDELGGVWFLLASLLGHSSVETTRNVYLEPFIGLQVEQLVALMDADDRAAMERLVDVVGRTSPLVLSAALS